MSTTQSILRIAAIRRQSRDRSATISIMMTADILKPPSADMSIRRSAVKTEKAVPTSIMRNAAMLRDRTVPMSTTVHAVMLRLPREVPAPMYAISVITRRSRKTICPRRLRLCRN